MCSQKSGQQTKSLNPIKFPESPEKKSGGTHTSAACTTMCNTLPQNVGHSAGQCTPESRKRLQSYPSLKFKEPQREGCSSYCDQRRSKGGRRRKSNPTCRSNYHLTEKFQVQEFVQPIGAHSERAKDNYRGPGKHCLWGRDRMFNSRSHN